MKTTIERLLFDALLKIQEDGNWMLGLTSLEAYVSVFVVTGEINESRSFSKEEERVKKIEANLSMDFEKKTVMKKKVK